MASAGIELSDREAFLDQLSDYIRRYRQRELAGLKAVHRAYQALQVFEAEKENPFLEKRFALRWKPSC